MDINKEEGIEESTRKLSEQATKLNQQRFDIAIKIKVRFNSGRD